jgi:hypothetical protein
MMSEKPIKTRKSARQQQHPLVNAIAIAFIDPEAI